MTNLSLFDDSQSTTLTGSVLAFRVPILSPDRLLTDGSTRFSKLATLPKTYDFAINIGPHNTAHVFFANYQRYINPYSFDGYRHLSYGNGNGYSIPLSEVAVLLQLAKTKGYTYTIDKKIAEYVNALLKVQQKAMQFANAEDAPEIENNLAIKYRPFQRAAIRFSESAFENGHGAVEALDMGLGKTAVVIGIVERNDYRIVMITKASLKENLDREIRKQTGKRPVHLGGRVPGRAEMEALLDKSNQYFILNYEVIGTNHDTKDSKGLHKVTRPWADMINLMCANNLIQAIACDEIHTIRNSEAKSSQAIMSLRPRAPIGMSGTLIVNRIDDYFPVLHFIAPAIFPSKAAFLNAYSDGAGGIKNPDKFQKDMLPFIFRRATKDVIKDLPPIIRLSHDVTLDQYHKDRYDTALMGVFQKLDGSEREINSVLPQLNYLRQIVSDVKAEATAEYVQDILDTTNDKVLVFTTFVEPAKRIAKALNCNVIYGETPKNERMRLGDVFNDPNSDQRVLVLTVATGQEGLTLTGGQRVVFNDLCWTAKDHNQAERRVYARLNDMHGATATYVRAKSNGMVEIDQLMDDIIQRKMTLFDTAVEGTKEYAQANESIVRELMSMLKGFR